MKLFRYIFSACVLAAALAACNTKEALDNPVVTTAQGAYEIPAEGGDIPLVFHSNMPWKITVAPGNSKSDITGIRVTPSSGNASQREITVTIHAGKNEGAKRVAIISILGTQSESAVQLTQASANAPAGPEAGTLSNPYKASVLADAVKGGDIPLGTVYVRGKVTKVVEISGSYGNGTFWITDADSEDPAAETFEIFRGKKRGGASYTDADEANPPVKTGDIVTVAGEATLYNGVAEFKSGNELIAVNGLADAPLGAGTQEDPYNVAKAMKVAIASGESGTAEDVYVKGIISKIKEISTSYGNATYWISDDGFCPDDNNTILQIYRGYSFNGDKFTDAEALVVGDEVVIVGRLKNYGGDTPETNSGAKLVSLNGKTE